MTVRSPGSSDAKFPCPYTRCFLSSPRLVVDHLSPCLFRPSGQNCVGSNPAGVIEQGDHDISLLGFLVPSG